MKNKNYCDNCDKIIDDDEGEDFDGILLCEDCADEFHQSVRYIENLPYTIYQLVVESFSGPPLMPKLVSNGGAKNA